MPVYEYTARTAAGDETTGTLDLPSMDAVRDQLRQKRLILVRVREQVKKKRSARVPTRDVVIFTRQFATMINSGRHLGEADREQNARLRHPAGRL
jgi:type IV pilus assembly protein PilC